MKKTETTKYNDGNRFYILNEFDNDMRDGVVANFTAKIDELKSRRNETIELWIDSNGGRADLLFHLIELVELAKRNGITVRTIVTARAYSAGSMLAVTGTKGERYISRLADHLPHYGSFDGYRKTTPLQLDRDYEHFKRHSKKLIDHYKRYAEIPALEEKLKDDHLWIPASKCIKWSLADKYMEELK
ncbi:ATP-dependent Clp protease proteolytic subunit [Rhodococcus qingshengii]|uniref:ATP-dependent Clp protease proteolytic subunit n=1 Tax=Rhodococcus qingshengii TaxID=334542 RepID=UPI002941D64F|nr:ATP-dependent Clp protease proteolytic subunit [Rhodococcus qingshengii]WOI85957.1 ATP-dependent Clp protease proteolytic subunit [Rhodococcus qingshengii]